MDDSGAQLQQSREMSHSSPSNSNSRNGYRLFPVVEDNAQETLSETEDFISIQLEDWPRPKVVPREPLAARRGRKLSLSNLKPVEEDPGDVHASPPKTAGPTPPARRDTVTEYNHFNSLTNSSIRSRSNSKNADQECGGSSKHAAQHVANVKDLAQGTVTDTPEGRVSGEGRTINYPQGLPSAVARQYGPAVHIPLPRPSQSSKHRRQASSVSTVSMGDASIDQVPTFSATQKSYSRVDSNLHLREVTVAGRNESSHGPILHDIDPAYLPDPLPPMTALSRSNTMPYESLSVTPERPRTAGRMPKRRKSSAAVKFETTQRPATAGGRSKFPASNISPPPLPAKNALRLLARPQKVYYDLQSSTSGMSTPPLSSVIAKPLPDLPVVGSSFSTIIGIGAKPKNPAAPASRQEATQALADITRQCDAIYARYDSLRSDRLKLTTEILANLKVASARDYENGLVTQHLALNALTASMDICFAKLKSLQCRKDQAVATLLAMAMSGPASNPETISSPQPLKSEPVVHPESASATASSEFALEPTTHLIPKPLSILEARTYSKPASKVDLGSNHNVNLNLESASNSKPEPVMERQPSPEPASGGDVASKSEPVTNTDGAGYPAPSSSSAPTTTNTSESPKVSSDAVAPAVSTPPSTTASLSNLDTNLTQDQNHLLQMSCRIVDFSDDFIFDVDAMSEPREDDENDADGELGSPVDQNVSPRHNPSDFRNASDAVVRLEGSQQRPVSPVDSTGSSRQAHSRDVSAASQGTTTFAAAEPGSDASTGRAFPDRTSSRVAQQHETSSTTLESKSSTRVPKDQSSPDGKPTQRTASPSPSRSHPSAPFRPPPHMRRDSFHRHAQEDSTHLLSTSASSSSSSIGTSSSCADEPPEALTPRQSEETLDPAIGDLKNTSRPPQKRRLTTRGMCYEAHDFLQLCEGSFA